MRYKPACGAHEVGISAAESGFGPMMYHAGMSIKGPNFLMPDRMIVSDSALNVWRKFYTREDVVKEILPKDCQYKLVDQQSKVLNYKYTLKSPVDFSQLIKHHEDYLENSEEYFDYSNEQFTDILYDLASKFFTTKINDD